MRGLALFRSFAPDGAGWRETLADPLEILAVHEPGEVIPALRRLERAAAQGRWVAFALSYEAAPAFDPAMRVRSAEGVPPAEGFPLLWAGVYERPRFGPEPVPDGGWLPGPWRPSLDRAGHERAVTTIRELLRQGEAYQVNFTFPSVAACQGDPLALFLEAGARSGAGYAAYLDLGRWRALSFSPELFFSVRGASRGAARAAGREGAPGSGRAGGQEAAEGRRIEVRPMKGTMPRGRGPARDAAARAALAACPKNRAENVMIVDLLRNDLGRLARPGTVRTPRLFEIESYPTVFQMTSTVTAELRPEIGLADLLASLFPCGSVTGAPKIRAMEIIADLEGGPRGLYCGAIGLMRPGGDVTCSVAIRTLVLEAGSATARFDVGGGVTWDSTPRGEFAECGAKAAFLRSPGEPWRLLETLLLAEGRFLLPEGHLRRLARSAAGLGFPFDPAVARETLLGAAAERPVGRWKVRLLLSPGGGLAVEAAPLAFGRRPPLRVGLLRRAVRSGDARLVHKTTDRALYERARRARPDCDDVLLLNERDELTESTIASLVVRLGGRLVTPALACGLLPGVLRERLLERGALVEARLRPADLRRARRIWLVNAVRGWMRVGEVVDDDGEVLSRA